MSRILVVEDEPSLARGLEDDLELEGYEVEVVGDGRSAVERAIGGGFDLVLLDVMLPGKDGFEVCRKIRRAGLEVPIVMLTARSHESDTVLGLELGADDYVTKPFSPRELRARIKAVLRRSATAPPETCELGEVVIDFDRREATRAGESIELTPRELDILEVLARYEGRAVSRETLLDEAWGPGTYLSDRTVDTHIANLRKKIEDDPAEPRFVTSVRGVGYRLDR